MKKLDFLSLLDSFGVLLTIYPKDEKGGEYINGIWVKKECDEKNKVEVNEPFIPSSLLTQVPVNAKYAQGGNFEEYDMIWFSSQEVNLQSKVKHNGITYSIESAIPYTDYSNVTQYGCKAVEKIV